MMLGKRSSNAGRGVVRKKGIRGDNAGRRGWYGAKRQGWCEAEQRVWCGVGRQGRLCGTRRWHKFLYCAGSAIPLEYKRRCCKEPTQRSALHVSAVARNPCNGTLCTRALLQGTPATERFAHEHRRRKNHATGLLYMSAAAKGHRKRASQKVIARGVFARRYCRAAQDSCWLPVIARGAFARFARRHCRRRRPRKKRPQPKGHTWTTSFFL